MKLYRTFKPGFPHHVYSRAIDSFVIFYSTTDCIYYYTLFMCLARRYGIRIMGFCIMPNHVHSIEEAPDRDAFLLFHQTLNSIFTRYYNCAHNRRGPIFSSPFGFAPKTNPKRIRDAISYVANNPVAGKLSTSISKYRWNLISYYSSSHPFSEKTALRNASKPLRRAFKQIEMWRQDNLPVTYIMQEKLYDNFSLEERFQILDKIVALYNEMDYQAIGNYYHNSFENAEKAINLGGGSEYDIQDEYDDYCAYNKMSSFLSAKGIDMAKCNFRKERPEILAQIQSSLESRGFSKVQISRFLHRAWRISS